MSRSIVILFFYFIGLFFSIGQNNNSIVVKYFVKDNKVLFRIIPKTKTVFEKLKANAVKITRYALSNSKMESELVVQEMLQPYYDGDTSKWMPLARSDKNTMAFVYNALYQKETDSKISPQKKEQIEKMIYDLLLLSCNFDVSVSKACGLFFMDTTVNNKQNYLYKFAVYTHSKSATTTDLLTVKVDAGTLSTNATISDLTVKSKNKISTLKWKAANYREDFSGYNIERSTDSVNFKKINNTPIILIKSQFEKNKEYIFYCDTMPLVHKHYFYRIRGINFFGEESDPSNIVSSLCAPSITSIPLIDSIKVINNRSVRLSWRMENFSETKLIKKYVLLRSEKDNGSYMPLFNSSTELKFIDLQPLTSNFYKVGAVTFNDDTLYSYSRMAIIIDTIAPLQPTHLKAVVNKNGNVILTWLKNKESDLQGYKLFKANNLTEEFVQVNTKFIKDTFYLDKLNLHTLSKTIYYTIAASDKNFNTSVRCLPIEVRRPDTIAPAAPILKSVYPNFKGMALNFILSNSDDVFEHSIYRKSSLESNFIKLKTIAIKDTLSGFMDTTVEYNSTYTYMIKAVDMDTNASYSKNLTSLYETGFRKKLQDINYVVDRTKKQIVLKWVYDEKNVQKFIVYRAKEQQPLTIVKTLQASVFSFSDSNLNIGNTYEYRIKAMFDNGAESLISDAIKVIY